MSEAGPKGTAGGNDYTVRAVVRAVRVLELLRTSDTGSTLQELATGSGLAKASAFRMLRTLEELGLVQREPGGDRFRLGVRCLEFGQAYLEQVDVRSEALPVMERLRDGFNETVHLGVLDDELRVVYLEKLEGTHAVGLMMSRVGRTAPSYCTGIGKALLADLADDPVERLTTKGLHRYTPNTLAEPDQLRADLKLIRERGYSLDLEEHEPGVKCVAVALPVREGHGGVAISISGPAHRMADELLTGELAAAALAAAREIGQRLGAVAEKRLPA